MRGFQQRCRPSCTWAPSLRVGAISSSQLSSFAASIRRTSSLPTNPSNNAAVASSLSTSSQTSSDTVVCSEQQQMSTSCENEPHTAGEVADVVTPWSVRAVSPKGIDYDRVLTRFRSQPVDTAVVDKLSEVLRERAQIHKIEPLPVHHFFKRGLAFSHRDFFKALDCVQGSIDHGRFGAFLYTGRGPSARSMHIGHVIPLLLTKYLQDALGLPLVIQITDDEKYLFRDVPLSTVEGEELIRENVKDVIAFGFDRRRTFIFRNTHYMGELYPTVLQVQRNLTLNAIKNTFGFVDTDNVGKVSFPAIQVAPCFNSAFTRILPVPPAHENKRMQCIIPCAIDQDPFFVLARSISARMKQLPPALVHTKFLPALKGPTHKMSSSAVDQGVIALTDTDTQVRKKMRKAFSGGSGTLEDMRTQGVDLDVDVAYQFIRFFSPDDDLVKSVAEKYTAGVMNSGQVKDLAAEVIITNVLAEWRERRGKVNDDDVDAFCSIRSILL